MMWFLLLLLHVARIQPVILKEAQPRLVLRNGDNPCSGHVEIFYDDKWGVVGDKFWNRSTEEVICKSTSCGDPVATENVRRPLSTTWLNELKCDGGQKELWECDSPGWDISYYPKRTVKKIKCSYNISFSLEGPTCAGAVRYSTDGVTPAGYICNDNWGETEARLLCKELGCGDQKRIPPPQWWSGQAIQKPKKLNCTGIDKVDNLWQCAVSGSAPCQHPASVICSGYERLQLIKNDNSVCSGRLQQENGGTWEDVNNNKSTPNERCHQMHCGAAVGVSEDNAELTCTDNVKVHLKGNCYGAVQVSINGSVKGVCGSTWTKTEAEVVCRELECGKVHSFSTGGGVTQGIMDFVECLGNEASLWHCQAKHGKDLQCSAAHVVCSNSMAVRLADGGGGCAGRLEVKHEGSWKRVRAQGWGQEHANIVCKELKCGNKAVTGNAEMYSQGSGSFLAVECKPGIGSVSHITECITTQNTNNARDKEDAVGITCESHKVVFLSGSCSGEVGIKQGSTTSWLSGSTSTWTNETANVVCRQMHCGQALSFSFKSSGAVEKDIWPKSYECSSTEPSLFNCSASTPSSDFNKTVATVTCSGNITVNLTKECWGNVNVCVGGKCGGVCADAWTEEKSKMLCEEQRCGSKILKSINPPMQSEVVFKSLHAMKQNAKLNECNFIKSEGDFTCDRKPASVVCSDSVKSRFRASRDKCSGNVEVFYEGKWLPVCKDALKSTNTQNAICRELNCGKVNQTIDYFGPTLATSQVIGKLECSDRNAASLRACDVTTETNNCELGGLRCSEWKTVALEHDEACQGEVVVHSKGKISAVSSEGWTEAEGRRLCEDMKCGNNGSIRENVNRQSGAESFFRGKFSCASQPNSIWECEKSATSSRKRNLFVECHDKTKVTLSHGCHGELRINGVQVCAKGWKEEYSNKVCQELNCSNAINFHGDVKSKPNEKYHHIHCDEHHHKLGQCRRVEGTCNEAKLVSIYCVENIKFNTTEKCGGQVEVNYRDKWEKVCIPADLSSDMKTKLCRQIHCDAHNDKVKPKQRKVGEAEMRLNCNKNHMKVKHCLQKATCDPADLTEIYCKGYKPKVTQPRRDNSLSTVTIVVIVGFLLVVVILIALGARFYLVRRTRKSRIARMLSGKEMEFESGDYEDVDRDNELEDFRDDRFRPEDEFGRDDDRRSAASLSYDDIDKAAEAQPLAPAADTAGDGYMQEDQVTYEGEDLQENYDDIEADPVTTKADVHDSPKTTAHRDAAAPPGPVQREEDYLVPGQDG